jgi:signal transduction histidine kinase
LRHLQETQNSLIESEKLAALGRLVAGVAHEVNSPVGTSLTIASSLESKTAQFAAQVAQGNLKRSSLNNFLEVSRKASTQLVANLVHAAELVQSFKQVAIDRSSSNRRIFDLGDITTQADKSLRAGLRNRGLTVGLDCPPDLTMNSYPGPYGQVLSNLFLNSMTHGFPDDRGGTIGIKVRALGDEDVEIRFSDDGCGMSADVRQKAFDPFFSTRRDQGCTGLGLHIAHTIVTNCLGGQVSLDSEPDEGTQIRIILPRMAPAAPPL